MRALLLYLSGSPRLRAWMEASRLVRPLVRRFIAGETLEDALAVCGRVHQDGVDTALDYLGENVASREEALRIRDAYLEALPRLARCGGSPSVSIKLTQFGLDISTEFCRENVEQLAAAALAVGIRVEVDMESSGYVDRTLELVHDLSERHGNLRAVIQAYLRRSRADIEALCDRSIPVRLCKGAYLEPPEVAFPRKRDVDRNYLALMRLLFERGTDPAFATHDAAIVKAVLEHVRKNAIPRESFEFQMLFGIRRDLQRKLSGQGCRLRLYVPYGEAWYPYFMRRLAERPANILFLVKNLIRV